MRRQRCICFAALRPAGRDGTRISYYAMWKELDRPRASSAATPASGGQTDFEQHCSLGRGLTAFKRSVVVAVAPEVRGTLEAPYPLPRLAGSTLFIGKSAAAVFWPVARPSFPDHVFGEV